MEICKISRLTIIICLVILCHIQISDCDSNSNKIIIIGAGAAGIAAASKLFEHGFNNITILEAESRIGGRIFTTKLANSIVDLGAQYVNGEDGNVVYDLAYPLGLLDKLTDSSGDYRIDQYIFDSFGEPMDDELTKKITDFDCKYIYRAKNDNSTDFDESLGRRAERLFIEKFKNIPEIYEEKQKYLFLMEIWAIGDSPADSWHNIPLLKEHQFKDYKGDPYINWKGAGYSTILNVLMKSYPNPEKELPVLNNTIFNSEVVSIDYSQVINGSSISISTKKKQTYEADHVIVTIPLGVLKEKYQSLFKPALPNSKIEAIKGFGYGARGTILLLYDKPFWPIQKKTIAFHLLWDDSEKKRIVQNDPEKSWLLGINSVSTVPDTPNLLKVRVSADHAKLMELLSENQVRDHIKECLHKFLHKKYNITNLIAMTKTQWYTNRHFRGSSSYRTFENRNITPEMLEAPVMPEKLTIIFAGEATSKDRYSTVDGAISSGWKAADKLIEYYKMPKIF